MRFMKNFIREFPKTFMALVISLAIFLGSLVLYSLRRK